jgi:hypothetical protein
VGYDKTAAMAAVIGSAVISWALPGYRMVPGSSVYKAKGYFFESTSVLLFGATIKDQFKDGLVFGPLLGPFWAKNQPK